GVLQQCEQLAGGLPAKWQWQRWFCFRRHRSGIDSLQQLMNQSGLAEQGFGGGDGFEIQSSGGFAAGMAGGAAFRDQRDEGLLICRRGGSDWCEQGQEQAGELLIGEHVGCRPGVGNGGGGGK
ncbi:MAG TPA: hypothetical protein DC058_10290, partial [Planctomycetaceae bacterium]|nr:hypothetical protein [Planctomycetaceae bacterium]